MVHRQFARGTVAGVSFCPGDVCFVTFGGEEIAFRTISNGEVLWRLKIQTAKGVVFTADGSVVVGAGGNEPVSGWDMAQRKPRTRYGAKTSRNL